MNVDALELECPSCGGSLAYDPSTGKLVCDSCGSCFDVGEFDSPKGAWDKAPELIKSYDCPSCGAALMCDETTVAVCCPYCGSRAILEGRVSGALRPERLVPFQTTKEDAVAALRKHYEEKLLLPGAFVKENHVEDVQGVYVPFWMFDCEADGEVRLRAERITKKYKEIYELVRGGRIDFQGVPADGSTKMPDQYMDSIGPYDYLMGREFSPAYMPGFLAERYDQRPEELFGRLQKRVEEAYVELAQDSASSYDDAFPVDTRITVREKGVHYAMLPVWLLATRWRDKSFLFAMNGQTGKFIGDLPVHWGKGILLFIGATLFFAIFSHLFAWLAFDEDTNGIFRFLCVWGVPALLGLALLWAGIDELKSVKPVSAKKYVGGGARFSKSEDVFIKKKRRKR